MHAQDVSERVRLEEELQRLREEIEERAEERLARGADSGLTFREVTVLTLMARGKSDKEIAALLGLSPFTVNKHASNLVRKLAARSRTEAAARAVREGII
jgi:two-component system NarL family response regulator